MYTFIVGTRPELVKTRSVLAALQARGIPHRILCTDQHTDLLASFAHDPVFRDMVHLGLPHHPDPLRYVEETTQALVARLARDGGRPGPVFVQGDTGTALAGAKAGALAGVLVYHIEAGIRTHDISNPWPEEQFRVEIAHYAFVHFAASEENAAHLRAEGVRGVIHVVGNPGLDRLRDLPRVAVPHPKCLVTLHRRESFGEPLRQILQGLAHAAERHPEIEFLFPVHPNPAVHETVFGCPLPVNVYKLPPLPSEVFTQLLASSRAVLTDSGGVQEEAAFLGVPCVVARTVTDRPESVASGHAILAGTDVADPLHQALTFGLTASRFLGFGDGQSGVRIVDLLTQSGETGNRHP